jgi:hypothetical protein
MTLGQALERSKIAMLELEDKVVLVTNSAAYEAPIKMTRDSVRVFRDFKLVKNFNNIPASKEWKAIGYHE